jgi:hypothetical protein
MLSQLRLQRAVQQPARQVLKQPAGPSDLLRGVRAGEQRVEHLVRDLRPLQRGTARQPRQHLSPLDGIEVASLLAYRLNIF